MNNKPGLTVYAAAFLPAALIVVIAAMQPWANLDDLFRDSLEVAIDKSKTGECCHAYFGLLSKFGALIWCATAAICLFSSLVLMRIKRISLPAGFLAAGAFVTAMLLFDDFFLGHEVVFVKLFGIEQHYVFMIYGLIVLSYLILFRRLILHSGYMLLFISLVFFAISIFVDQVFEHVDGVAIRVAEDGSKLLGITGWATFHIRAAWLYLTNYQD